MDIFKKVNEYEIENELFLRCTDCSKRIYDFNYAMQGDLDSIGGIHYQYNTIYCEDCSGVHFCGHCGEEIYNNEKCCEENV